MQLVLGPGVPASDSRALSLPQVRLTPVPCVTLVNISPPSLDLVENSALVYKLSRPIGRQGYIIIIITITIILLSEAKPLLGAS